MKAWYRVVLEQEVTRWPLLMGLGVPSVGDLVTLADGREAVVGRVAWFPFGEPGEPEPSVLIVMDPLP